jgi:hypothetical protein
MIPAAIIPAGMTREIPAETTREIPAETTGEIGPAGEIH